MATPIQPPMEEVSPSPPMAPPPSIASPPPVAWPPPLEPSSFDDNVISPTIEPIDGNSPEIPNPPAQSTPPPLLSPPPEPSPSPPPPIGVPPPTPTLPDPPPPPEGSPPPQHDQPAISPPSRPSVPPPESSPSPPAPEPPRTPPTLDPPVYSPPPPPSVRPPRPALSPPASARPAHSPPPPPHVPERPTHSPPPPLDSERPAHSPPPPQDSEPSPPDSKRPTHSPPPPPPRDSELPEKNPPPPAKIPPHPKPSPAPLPSNSSSSPSPPSIIPRHSPPQNVVPGSDNPSHNNSTPTVLDNSRDWGIGTAVVVGVSIGVALVLLSLIGFVVWCLKRRKKRLSATGGGYVMPSPSDPSPRSDSALSKTHSSAPLVGNRSSNRTFFSQTEPCGFGHSKEMFSYEDLAKATNGFSDVNLLGEGGFGCVYKGVLPDGRVVAVKQLKVGGGQGDREFKAEVETISRVHHRNLLSLVGYCISENRRLLIYDYVPNNNLYFHLHGTPGLDWATRVKIAAGAARGLAYLHEDCHPRIIHRDIKSSNILLENNFHPLVSDFGLAKLALDCTTHITTRVMGTFGYMAPEYASSGKLTEKSDVFSFGVVLLELVTGRKPVDTSQPLGDESLVEWARPLLSHAIETEEFKDLADPKLGGNYVDAEMFRMIEAAAACIRHSAAKRPRMSQIVRAFDSLAEEDLTNGMRLGESEIINSAEQSAEIRLFRRMAFGSQNYSTDFFTHNIYDSKDENV